MWTIHSESISDGLNLRFTVEFESRIATFSDVLHGWQNDAAFRALFTSRLANAPYGAFRWETPPVTSRTVTRPFEFVLLNSPELVRPTDIKAFEEHFSAAHHGVTVFPNLGGDAVMVVPCPMADSAVYGHLAAFVRLAPEIQQHALWQAVGNAMTQRIGAKPVWLSTAGAGVSWLHVRLDDRPKYYFHAPFRQS